MVMQACVCMATLHTTLVHMFPCRCCSGVLQPRLDSMQAAAHSMPA